MTLKRILNVDDFALAEGIDHTAIDAFLAGNEIRVSFMATSHRAPEAARMLLLKARDLPIGLHFNLTSGSCVAPPYLIPELVDGSGKFRCGFLKLFFMSLFRKDSLRHQAGIELSAQLEKLDSLGLTVTHLDGHRHVHLIPGIIDAVLEKMASSNIKTVRLINERLWSSLKATRDISFLWNGNIIKFAVLRTLTKLSGLTSKTYFFSILYSCRIDPKKVQRLAVPIGYCAVEVMVHPYQRELESGPGPAEQFPEEKKHFSSSWRQREISTLHVWKIEK